MHQLIKQVNFVYNGDKAITVTDEKRYERDVKWYHEYGHYAIDVDGKRYCTCDNVREVREELEEIRKEFLKSCCQNTLQDV